jgi:glycosyltransferase involved in cell wall biosynthesis
MPKPGYPSISVIICALNEELNLPYILPRIPVWVDEILLVDGHSTDATVAVAKQLRPEIKILCQSGRGKGDALKYGIEKANGEIVVTLDADKATDPCEMDNFINPLLQGYDFSKGSRFIRGKTRNKKWYRIFGNWIIVILFNTLFLRSYTDLCSGFNAFHKDKLKNINPFSSDGYENEPLINAKVAKSKLKVIEVGHTDCGRINGEIKEATWRQGFKAILSIFKVRFSA